jgi:hypothetical protein
MKDFPRNHYETAFENWLIDNHVQYIAIDERKKAAFAKCKVKSFDFLLYPRTDSTLRLRSEPALSLPKGQAGSPPLPRLASGDAGARQDGRTILVEVKGRKFKGASLSKLTGLECWVTTDDIDGLTKWQEVFGPGHQVIFVFAYEMENIDVDFDGRAVYDFTQKRYVFLCIKLDDYRSFMKVRSPKWRTVTLPADRFRWCAVEINEFLL